MTNIKHVEHENIISKINYLARQVPSREGELDRPLEWEPERNMWIGFFCNYDDGRGILESRLRSAGFTEVFRKASYHWKLRSKAFGFNKGPDEHYVEIEYIEGDLYATYV